MSRSQNLRRSVVNQIIDGIARGHIPSPLPVQSALGEMFNISRTTVRHILTHLQQRGVLINASPIVRLVTHLDVSRQQLADVVGHWQAFLQR